MRIFGPRRLPHGQEQRQHLNLLNFVNFVVNNVDVLFLTSVFSVVK